MTWSQVVSWLQENAVPKYFASVTSDSYTTCKDSSGNTVLTAEYGSSGGSSFKVYKSSEFYQSIRAIGLINSIARTLFACEGGLLIHNAQPSGGSSTYYQDIIITKNINDVTTIIIGDWASSHANRSSKINVIAWGDDESDNPTLTFNASSQYQTQFIPFTTFIPYGDKVSYTPNVFYMPVGQFYDLDFGIFQSGEYTYVTNGYWAIKDAPIETNPSGNGVIVYEG